MTNDKETGQPNENKSSEPLSIDQEKTMQEKYKKEQEKFKAEQEKSKAEQEKWVEKKRELELEILRAKYKKRKCLILFLNIMIGVFSFVLIFGGILVFCSIKEAYNNTYNWIRLGFGSLMMASFVVLIVVLSHLIKKLVSDSEEE